MRIAFYAPMKPPTHPVPSGDRRMAGLLIRALGQAGHDVSLASPLRSYDRTGDAHRQARIRRIAARVTQRYLSRHHRHRPDLWFTYHIYHKAPDWIGPAVTDRLSIPYVVADPIISPSQASGPWTLGYDAAAAAIAQADRLIAFDPIDIPAVDRLRQGDGSITPLPPFLDPPQARSSRPALRAALAAAHALDPDIPWLATVAMMRHDVKRDSYRLLADALGRLRSKNWALLIAGDGPARDEIEPLMHAAGRVVFLGRVSDADITDLYHAADLAVWPALKEGYAMALVEAQACGLPVVAGYRPGIAQVVEDGRTGLLTPEGDGAAFAAAIETLLSDPSALAAMTDRARNRADRLGLDRAARRLDTIVRNAHAERRRERAP